MDTWISLYLQSNEGVECPCRKRPILWNKDYREVVESDIHTGEQNAKAAVETRSTKAHFVRIGKLGSDCSEGPLSTHNVAMLQRTKAVPVRVFQSRRQPCARPLVFANKFSAPMACPKMHEVYLQQIAPQNSKGCCQTNDFKHQIDGAIEIYALNN